MQGAAPPFAISRRRALVAGASVSASLWPALAHAQTAAAGSVRSYAPELKLRGVDHAVVYRREDEMVGWPHIMGFWNLGNGELLQQVTSITTRYASADAVSHDNLGREGLGSRQLAFRSLDHGLTWGQPVTNMMDNADPAQAGATRIADLQPIDFLDADVIVANSATAFGAPTARTNVRVSRDRGHTWGPQIQVPLDAMVSNAGMNSSLARPDGTSLIWLMEVGESGWDRHPCVFALPPGGHDYHFLTFITPKVDPFAQGAGDYSTTFRYGGHRWFYPRGYLLPSGRMLCVLRCQRDPRGIMWTEVFASDDGGRTWGFLSRVNDFGAPGSLVVKQDGRLVMVYGYRLAPQGIRAKVSEDGGATWGRELIVRDDGGSWDLGYPNAWELPDGRIGCLYYFNSKDDPVQAGGGVRHIQRSIFSID